MKQARSKKTYFKVNDTVAIKIDKVDTTSPLHPNALIGKVLQVENNYTNNFNFYFNKSLKQMHSYK